MLKAWMQATWPWLRVGGRCQRVPEAMLPVITRQMDIQKMNCLTKFPLAVFQPTSTVCVSEVCGTETCEDVIYGSPHNVLLFFTIETEKVSTLFITE